MPVSGAGSAFLSDRGRAFLQPRVGSLDQITRLRRSILADGPGRGVETIEVATGSGFRFDVLAGRGLDIGHAEFAGLPIAWRSATGELSPNLYDPHGFGWLRSFHGGLLTGCGLRNAGPPSDVPEQRAGLHGRLSNTPAESVWTDRHWDGDRLVLRCGGSVREVAVFGESLVLHRTITTELGASYFELEDIVENAGHRRVPHMLLYHMNFGWPLVDEGSRVLLPATGTTPRDEVAAAGLDAWMEIPAPSADWEEQVFFHELAPCADGVVRCAIVRTEPPALGVELRFLATDFPFFAQWKMTGAGEYVVALEPANCLVEGFENELAHGRVEYLEPGGQRTYRLRLSVLADRHQIAELVAGAYTAGQSAGRATP